MHRHSQLLDRVVPVAALVSTLGLLAAVLYFADASNHYWEPHVLVDVLGWAGFCTLGAGILRYFVPTHAAAYLSAAVLLYLAVGIGLVQSAAAVLLVFSWYWYGRATLSLMFPQQGNTGTDTQCILVGLALYQALFGIMIHFPVNYRSVYFAITLVPLPVILCSGKLPVYWNSFWNKLTALPGTVTLPYSFLVLLVILFGLLCRLAFLPTLGFDDNTLHLGMWNDLSYRHVAEFDVVTQIWVVAPFAVDLLHAILSMLADEDARPALNVFFLAFLLRQLWVILGHFFLRQHDRALLLLLFISTPLVGAQFISLQTELLMAGLVASGLRLVLETEEGWYSRNSAAILAVAALCCAVKLPGAYIGALLVFAAIIKLAFIQPRTVSAFTPGRSLLLVAFIGMLGVTAFNSYFTAWRITGNPVFPLYNGVFQSPYYEAVNLMDNNWMAGFSFPGYVKVFFKTSSFFESWDLVAGFQYLFLLPLGVIALWRRVLPLTAIVVLLPLFGFGFVMFSIIQYWRYLFPVLPLAAVVIGSLLMTKPSGDNRSLTAVRLAIILCMGLNFYFYPGISGTLRNISPADAYTRSERQAVIERHGPYRAVNEYLNSNAPGMRVLYPNEIPFGTTLNGKPVYVTWYSPANAARAAQIQTEADLVAFLEDQQIDFVISYLADGSTPGNPKWLLREYLSHAAFPEYILGDYILYRLLDHNMAYTAAYSLENGSSAGTVLAAESAQAELVPPATLPSPFVATETPSILATVKTGAAKSARYRVGFSCAVNTGYFVAQLNWNAGAAYYRLVPCADGIISFVEALPVPAGATGADIYVTAWGIPEITLHSLALEIN